MSKEKPEVVTKNKISEVGPSHLNSPTRVARIPMVALKRHKFTTRHEFVFYVVIYEKSQIYLRHPEFICD